MRHISEIAIITIYHAVVSVADGFVFWWSCQLFAMEVPPWAAYAVGFLVFTIKCEIEKVKSEN